MAMGKNAYGHDSNRQGSRDQHGATSQRHHRLPNAGKQQHRKCQAAT